MGVYIKGMEMPKSCPCELIGIGYDLQCSFVWGVPARVKEYYECCQNNTRPSWCPLVPVPPHGRLIDADDAFHVLTSYYHHSTDFQHEALKESLGRVPTIIPAEEGE